MSKHQYKLGDEIEYAIEDGWRTGTYLYDDGSNDRQHCVLSRHSSCGPRHLFRGDNFIRPLSTPDAPTDHTHDLAPGVQEAINAAASCCCNRPETATCPAPELTDGEAPTIRKSELRMALTDIDKSLNAARVGLLCDPPETKSPLAILTVIQDQIDSWLRGLGR